MKKIEPAAKAGYDGIELWLNDVYEYVGQGGVRCGEGFGGQWIVCSV